MRRVPGLHADRLRHSLALPKAKSQILLRLNNWLLERHRAGETSVLIVDEAQNLTEELLEEIRLMTNLETFTEKLLQVVLVGQPELDQRSTAAAAAAVAAEPDAQARRTAYGGKKPRAYVGRKVADRRERTGKAFLSAKRCRPFIAMPTAFREW